MNMSFDNEIRAVSGYREVLSSVVNAAGLFNKVVPALDAGKGRLLLADQ